MRHNLIEMPEGDVLIHAGDMTNSGRDWELEVVRQWLSGQNYAHKIVIAGNHDLGLELWGYERCYEFFKAEGIEYLQGTDVTLPDGQVVWGGPWTPEFWGAFQHDEGEVNPFWPTCPEGVDIVMTHGPAQYRLDRVESGLRVGEYDLAQELERIRPKHHVHGHIHESWGEATTSWGTAHNVAICNLRCEPVNPPTVFDI